MPFCLVQSASHPAELRFRMKKVLLQKSNPGEFVALIM